MNEILRGTGRRSFHGALVGCAVALAITGIWFLTPYKNLPLNAQLAVDWVAIVVWPASLVPMNIGYYYGHDWWGLAILFAECIGVNALLYAVVFAVGGWTRDALGRRLARPADARR